jgi:hypothetical protein
VERQLSAAGPDVEPDPPQDEVAKVRARAAIRSFGGTRG